MSIFRRSLYYSLYAIKGVPVRKYYRQYVKEEKNGVSDESFKKDLINLLDHCNQFVPYYSKIIKKINKPYTDDPFEYLRDFPILTKEIIRQNFEDLKSKDISKRKWHLYPSGGSTGKPIEIIQDYDYSARSGAIKLLFSKFAGKEIGELEVQLWGSLKDINKNTENWKARLMNKVTNTVVLNAFHMSPEKMRYYIDFLNRSKPKLLSAYTSSLFELAKFAENEKIEVVPQKAIITSAGTLHPLMREVIERVFHCRIFNRYGSREVGDIACEKPGINGLWVAPWGNYVEIVDMDGFRIPEGQEGEILLTSLTNFAMPLIRYEIGDRGYLVKNNERLTSKNCQILGEVIGRIDDTFLTKDGALIHPGYFITVLFFKKWIDKYQVIQKDYSHIVFRIVRTSSNFSNDELVEITVKTKQVMGSDCNVDFEFVEKIPENPSGKFRYLISEIQS